MSYIKGTELNISCFPYPSKLNLKTFYPDLTIK